MFAKLENNLQAKFLFCFPSKKNRMMTTSTSCTIDEYLLRLHSNDPTLTSLQLLHHSLDDVGARRLSKALTINSTLTSLDLYLAEVGEEQLSEALAVNSTLINLNLRSNSISDVAATRLSETLILTSTLSSLSLGFRSINEAGAARLTQALIINSTLTRLNLNTSSISPVLRSSILENVSMNRFERIHLPRFIQADSNFTSLDFRFDKIPEVGTARLSEALMANSTLTSLDLGRNDITELGITQLSDALRLNSTEWTDASD